MSKQEYTYNEPMKNFKNRTVWIGDNLEFMRGINSDSIDLIYLDPPFNSNKTYSAPIGSQAAGAAFKDTWTLSDLDVAWIGLIADKHPAMHKILEAAKASHGKGMQSYLCMMGIRLLEMHRILKSTGSLYLHCDPTASHYLKLLLDTVFGQDNFRNEIVWHYKSFHGNVRRYYARKHDTLLMYTKSSKWVFNRQWEDDNTDTIDFQRWRDYLVDGRYILAKNMPVQDTRFTRYLRRWIREEGRNPEPSEVVYEVRGQALDTVWDIKPIDPKDKNERLGYPTQKPRGLLERIIEASSNKGNIVLDPFCGCATTLVAAENLERKWIGIDLSSVAGRLVRERLRGPEFGALFEHSLVNIRTDRPSRSDIGKLPPYRNQKHILFGQQEGRCNGCRMDFPYKIFEVDHIVPQSKGGTDEPSNLQLLCGHCNKVKGAESQAYLIARLEELGYV